MERNDFKIFGGHPPNPPPPSHHWRIQGGGHLRPRPPQSPKVACLPPPPKPTIDGRFVAIFEEKLAKFEVCVALKLKFSFGKTIFRLKIPKWSLHGKKMLKNFRSAPLPPPPPVASRVSWWPGMAAGLSPPPPTRLAAGSASASH